MLSASGSFLAAPAVSFFQFRFGALTTSPFLIADAATRNTILFSMISFLGVLFIGYIYALKKNAFDWKR